MLNNPIFNTPDISIALLSVFRLAFIIASFFYIIFAIVVIRQIAVMRKTLITSFSPVITLLGYIHLGFAIFVTLLYLTIL